MHLRHILGSLVQRQAELDRTSSRKVLRNKGQGIVTAGLRCAHALQPIVDGRYKGVFFSVGVTKDDGKQYRRVQACDDFRVRRKAL